MRIIIIGFFAISLWANGALWAQEQNWKNLNRNSHNAQAVLINPGNNKIIFAGVPGEVLKSEDSGETWHPVLSIRGGRRGVNALAAALPDPNIVYAPTDNGLYRSNDLGARWNRIFKGRNNLERQCTAVLDTPLALYAGTRSGLFISRDNGRGWYKENKSIGDTAIFNLERSFSGVIIYLACVKGIFKSLDNGENWEKIYSSCLRENNHAEPDGLQEESPEKASDIRFVKAGVNNENLVFFSSAKGVYKSLDAGKSWQKLTEYGLLDKDVKMLCAASDSKVFALSRAGVFLYGDERWKEVTLTLVEGKLNYFTLDNADNIYIAAEGGVFKSEQDGWPDFGRNAFTQNLFFGEPKIRDVQDAAIKYAEVSPEKISQWRKKAAKKALLPQVSVGIDRNSSDLWHWEGGSTTRSDDDTLRRGQDTVDWDVSLSWDLGDVIWNDAQTGIDARSKLMVELREDILDQVNKLYFERLRIKSELNNLAIEDKNKRFEKQLKLEELTASLDALTRGYYSDQLAAISSGRQS